MPLVRIDWQGHIASVVGRGAAPDHRLVRAQLIALANERTRVRIATSLVLSKIQNSVETLKALPVSDRVESAIGSNMSICASCDDHLQSRSRHFLELREEVQSFTSARGRICLSDGRARSQANSK